MKARYNPFYFLGQAIVSIFRNGVMSMASIAVLLSCLIVLGGFSLLVHNINVNLDELSMLNEIVVFVEHDATEEEIAAVGEKIAALDNVLSVEHITKAEALEDLKSQSPEYESLYEDITPENNPLKDQFFITYEDNERVVTLVYMLGQIEDVYKVNNNLDIATKISGLKNGVLLIFTWFLLILFVVVLFVIINTIKLSVFSRRDEITVMRYVGATGWFIMLPFYLEGIIIGLVSSGIAFFLERFFYNYVETTMLVDVQLFTVVPFDGLSQYVLIGFLAIGVLAGVIGSSISLGKYAKV